VKYNESSILLVERDAHFRLGGKEFSSLPAPSGFELKARRLRHQINLGRECIAHGQRYKLHVSIADAHLLVVDHLRHRVVDAGFNDNRIAFYLPCTDDLIAFKAIGVGDEGFDQKALPGLSDAAIREMQRA